MCATQLPPPTQKPQSLEALLAMLENAPAGPFELDTALIYSPEHSDDESDRAAADRPRTSPAPSAAAPAARRQRLAPAERLAQLRRQQEQAELAECTFAPRTGRPPSSSRAQPGVPVEQRLLAAAGRARQAAARRILEERREAAAAECTFAPRLAPGPPPGSGEPAPRAPLHQRLNEEGRRRAAALASATARADSEATFQPSLNPASLKLAEQARRARLEAGLAPPPRQHAAPAAPAEPPFTPAINPLSARLLEVSATVPSDFRARQRFFELQREEHRRALAAAGEAGGGCTFRPDTGNAAAVLALSDTRVGQLLELPEQRWERMAVAESSAHAARRAAAAAEAAAAQPFAPRLNPRSLRLAGGRPAPGDADADGERQRRSEQARQEAEARALAECTFRPDTSKPRVVGYYDEYDPPQPRAALSIAGAAAAGEGLAGLARRIQQHGEERERWAAAVRADRERRAAAECTFAPDTRKAPVAMPTRPVVVPGLDRVLELRALKARQRREADARAAKVFLRHPRSPRSRGGATVPKPFALAGEALARRRRQEQAKQQEQG